MEKENKKRFFENDTAFEKENYSEEDFDIESLKNDNTTMYGETVCTEFAWLPLDKQKENAKKFDKITKDDKKSK